MTIVREQMEAIDEAILNKNFVHATLKFEKLIGKLDRPLKPRSELVKNALNGTASNAIINNIAKKELSVSDFKKLESMGISKDKPLDYLKYIDKERIKDEIFVGMGDELGLYELLIKLSNEVDKYVKKISKHPKKYYEPAEFEKAYMKIDSYCRLQLAYKLHQVFKIDNKFIKFILDVKDDDYAYGTLFNYNMNRKDFEYKYERDVRPKSQNEVIKDLPIFNHTYFPKAESEYNKWMDIVEENEYSNPITTDEECIKKLKANMYSINARMWYNYAILINRLSDDSIDFIVNLVKEVKKDLNNR